MISFAGSNSTSGSSSRFTAMGIDSGLPIVVAGGGRGGNYSREAIFLKYFCQRRGDYSREAINRRKANLRKYGILYHMEVSVNSVICQ